MPKSKVVRKNKNFTISIPEEVIFMSLSHELYIKHSMGPKDAIKTLALEYAYNPKARPLIDQVLENRLDEKEYMRDIMPGPIKKPEVALIKYVPESVQRPEDYKFTEPQKAKINRLRDEFYKKRRELKQIDPNDPQHKQTQDKAIDLLEERINAIWD